MPLFLIKLLTDPRALAGLAFMLVLAFAAVQSERLKHCKADLAVEKVALAASREALGLSEKRRAAEYAQAKTAVSEALSACEARVAEAHRSATVINRIVTRPASVDPKTNCPVRALIGAGELRDATGAG